MKEMTQILLNFRKQQLFQIFRQNKVSNTIKHVEEFFQSKRIQRFSQILANENVNYEEVSNLAWSGIPKCVRAKIWKYLLKYTSGNKDISTQILDKKRKQYKKIINIYLPNENIDQVDDQNQKKILKIIEGDIKRTLPESKILKNDRIKWLLIRCLYIWHRRHPASGYVQGINDLVVPFFLVFLSEYQPINLDEIDKQILIDQLTQDTLYFIQADMYWCISKILDIVTNNYVQGFNGIHQSYKRVQILLKEFDLGLYNHLLQQKVDLFCLSFREISTFLLRLFSPKLGIRFFDTLISYEEEYPTFLLYVFVAIFIKYSRKLKQMNFDQLMKFFQNMPTKKWEENQLETILSEAYVYKQLYAKKN